jgi:peptide deformylase
VDFRRDFRLLLYGPDSIGRDAKPVWEEDHQDLPKLREYMIEVMKMAGGIGLAAPQIGVFKQFIIVKEPTGKIADYVNPEVTRLYGKEYEQEEGCLSLPPEGNECLVPRLQFVDIVASTTANPKKEQKYSLKMMTARIVQHEVDHLFGTFFIDRVPDKRRRSVLERFHFWKAQLNGNLKEGTYVDAGKLTAHRSQSRVS